MELDTLYTVAEIGAYVIAGTVVAINLIAPLTKTETDNKVAKALTWVNDKLQMFVLPFLRAKRGAK